ncbi:MULTISPECIES: hypothetical protein [Streptomyces]|uniref:hypothetical protein n=1 Tax=Streptomyces TaxID=1883 RepID=UPI001902B8E7|nr:hypothetical protein [Streptomyces virginiae]
MNTKLGQHWSPQQTTQHLARLRPGEPAMDLCPETVYRALYQGLLDHHRAQPAH